MEKQIARMCQECPYCNINKGVCSKSPSEDITGELWYCPTFPMVKVMFFAVLFEHKLDFNDFTEEIKDMNIEAQNNGWYLNLRILKKQIEKAINNKLNNK